MSGSGFILAGSLGLLDSPRPEGAKDGGFIAWPVWSMGVPPEEVRCPAPSHVPQATGISARLVWSLSLPARPLLRRSGETG